MPTAIMSAAPSVVVSIKSMHGHRLDGCYTHVQVYTCISMHLLYNIYIFFTCINTIEGIIKYYTINIYI